jgi:hypothetical protein
MEVNEMLLQFVVEQQRMICELCRNDLLLIGCLQSSASPEVVAVAAATVRSTLYSVDVLADKIRSLDLQGLHH